MFPKKRRIQARGEREKNKPGMGRDDRWGEEWAKWGVKGPHSRRETRGEEGVMGVVRSGGGTTGGGRRPGAQVCRWREMGVGSVPGLERGLQAGTEGKPSRSRRRARGRPLHPKFGKKKTGRSWKEALRGNLGARPPGRISAPLPARVNSRPDGRLGRQQAGPIEPPAALHPHRAHWLRSMRSALAPLGSRSCCRASRKLEVGGGGRG